MHWFNVFITALTANYQDSIIAGLAKKGFTVGPAIPGKIVANGHSSSALLCLTVYKAEEIKAADIHKDVMAVLDELQAWYYSVIVVLASDTCWVGSNFNLPDQGRPPVKKPIIN